MTAAAAPASAVHDVRQRAAGLWEFVAETGFESLVAAASKDPNAKITVLLVSPETAAPTLAVKAPTTAAAERAVEAASASVRVAGARG